MYKGQRTSFETHAELGPCESSAACMEQCPQVNDAVVTLPPKLVPVQIDPIWSPILHVVVVGIESRFSGSNKLVPTDQLIRSRPVSRRSGMGRWTIHIGRSAISIARWAIHDRQLRSMTMCRRSQLGWRANGGSIQSREMSSHIRDTGCRNHAIYV